MSQSMQWKADLIEGYKTFRGGVYQKQNALYETLGTKGQNPKVFVISCADSRVEPSDIFATSPGEIFVVRNVANLVPASDMTDGLDGTSAALEYAVTVLGVDAVLIMGHESCGGIGACLDHIGDDPKSPVGVWMAILNDARDALKTKNPENAQREMEYEGVRESLRNLMSFDFVRERVEAGTLTLQGGHFAITHGELRFADENGQFQIVQSAA